MNRFRFAWVRLAVLALLIAGASPTLAQMLERNLPAALGPLDNPLKGFAAYATEGTKHWAPVSMAYVYASWRELEPREGEYRFREWEQRAWDVEPAKGRHVVFRIYLDYPTKPTGVPQWLLDKGVKMTPYADHGGGASPDYENPDLQRHLFKLIEALGKRYNAHPRVAFVQVGILGHWGEWHTWPLDRLFASENAQRRVVAAMRKAFPNKHLMGRNPGLPSLQHPWMGFHDDMIPQDTLGPEDWQFLPSMRRAKLDRNWKGAPTGGEMVPFAAKELLGTGWTALLKAVQEAHFSWIGPYGPALIEPPSDLFRRRTEELIRKLGYEYRLDRVRTLERVGAGKTLTVELDGTNQGNAPFYYPWKVELVLLDAQGMVAQRWPLSDDIRTWLPGKFQLKADLPVSVGPGSYRLAIGIVDPWTGKAAIRFANDLPIGAGYTVLAPVQIVRGR